MKYFIRNNEDKNESSGIRSPTTQLLPRTYNAKDNFSLIIFFFKWCVRRRGGGEVVVLRPRRVKRGMFEFHPLTC